jgi:single-strand DNA-binding protein
MVSFSLATSESYTTKDGKKVEQTEWHNVVIWRGLAEVAAKYLRKGKLIYLEGKLRTRAYDDKEGNKRYTTEIVADNFTMLGRKSDYDGSKSSAERSPEEMPVDFDESAPDDDLPF